MKTSTERQQAVACANTADDFELKSPTPDEILAQLALKEAEAREAAVRAPSPGNCRPVDVDQADLFNTQETLF